MSSVTDVDLMEWFPQEHSQEFYYATGVIGLICTMLLLRHMNRSIVEQLRVTRAAS